MINTINMNSSDWIDAGAACALLGVKPQTLYAYVSRKLVRAQADAGDRRRSLYARPDLEALLRQTHRPRARAEVAGQAIRWGDPVLATSISEVREGMLWLRGRSVDDCADSLTVEEMFTHLCDAGPISFADPVAPRPLTAAGTIGRALAFLAQAADDAPMMRGQTPAEIAAQGAVLILGVTNALLGRDVSGPIHLRLGQVWGLDARGCDLIRRALILLGDHELNPSTFAVRVAASTGASLPAALLCGMATLSGPRHGGVASVARGALQAAIDGRIGAFLRAHGDLPPYGFGFGHPLYRQGDPRARHLLDRLPPEAPAIRALRDLLGRVGQPPNIDAALAVLSLVHDLPEDAGLTIFAVGRLSGWIAHAIEQTESREIIRPRARYQPK